MPILRLKRSGRLLSLIAVACLAVGGTLLGLTCFRGDVPDPVSVSFMGCCYTNGWPYAVLRVKNNTSSVLEFGGGYETFCADTDCGRTGGGVGVQLGPKSSGEVLVTIPPANGPLQIRLEIKAFGSHGPWLLRASGLLDRIGVHVYHTYSSPKAPVRVCFGKQSFKGGTPFSSVFMFYDSTNTLTADPFKIL